MNHKKKIYLILLEFPLKSISAFMCESRRANFAFRWMSAPKAILCTFQIILISNCVVYDSKCLILSPAHARKKRTVAHLFKKYIYIYGV